MYIEEDPDSIITLKGIIGEIIIENHIYYDDSDIECAVEIIYPVVSGIVFNSNFSFIRNDQDKLLDMITYLVTHLS